MVGDNCARWAASGLPLLCSACTRHFQLLGLHMGPSTCYSNLPFFFRSHEILSNKTLLGFNDLSETPGRIALGARLAARGLRSAPEAGGSERLFQRRLLRVLHRDRGPSSLGRGWGGLGIGPRGGGVLAGFGRKPKNDAKLLGGPGRWSQARIHGHLPLREIPSQSGRGEMKEH